MDFCTFLEVFRIAKTLKNPLVFFIFLKVSRFRKSVEHRLRFKANLRYPSLAGFSSILHDFWLHFGSPGAGWSPEPFVLAPCCGMQISCGFRLALGRTRNPRNPGPGGWSGQFPGPLPADYRWLICCLQLQQYQNSWLQLLSSWLG